VLIQEKIYVLMHFRDVHGGAAAMAVTARQWQIFYKVTAVAARQNFFENIEKMHEFDRISVFTSKTA
jgi:hypothetical protein